MPPVTRRSKPSVSLPKTHSSTATGSASLPTTATQNALLDIQDSQQASNGSAFLNSTFDASRALAPVPSNSMAPAVADVLDPLHKIAERVGIEVELFAQTVDVYLDNLPTDRHERFSMALQLVDDFRQHAQQSVDHLERSHRSELAAQLRSEWKREAKFLGAADSIGPAGGSVVGMGFDLGRDGEESALPAWKAGQVRMLKQRKEEVDLWELFRAMLELYYHPDLVDLRKEQKETEASLPSVTQYTEEGELWERFLLADDRAREYVLVKAWLEQTADHQQSPLKGITEELEAKAGRGKGIWSHGWMHTREKIKGEKRLRSWPASADASLPQIKRSDNTELLVTNLDPDAASRQDRTLERPDAYSERAIWVACWEMLRRGVPWEDISRWCEERKEGWRAISMAQTSDLSRVQSTRTWRKMCRLASQSSCSSEYEAAVYGLLGGNYESAKKICRTIHDHLFAVYSSSLIQRFDHYVISNFPYRTNATRREVIFDTPEDSDRIIRDLVTKLRTQPITTIEAVQPMRILESYLLINEPDRLVFLLGHAISFANERQQGDKGLISYIDKYWDGDENLPEGEVILDDQTLRIATHIAVVLNTLRPHALRAESRDAEENLFVAYIQAIRATGKRECTTSYSSRLSESRWIVTMSRVIQDCTDRAERVTLLNLMRDTGRNVAAVLNESLNFCLTKGLDQYPLNQRPLRILESTEDKKLYPGQRIIAGFLPEHTSESDDAIIRSLQWYGLLPKHWSDTFHALTKALRQCLVAGRIACALKIVREFPYDHISTQKSYETVGTSVNMMETDGRVPEWEAMARQSRTYYELGHLVNAIAALSLWRDVEQRHTSKRHKSPPTELKEAKTFVDEAMQPILSGIFGQPIDDDEDVDLAAIRRSYIPEVVIAYNTVLHSAGSIITRHALVESMDLSVTIANDENRLGECFVLSGRMRELVTSFAYTSKAMLLLKSEGGKWVAKKEREGKDLGIWEIGPQSSRSVAGDREIAPFSLD